MNNNSIKDKMTSTSNSISNSIINSISTEEKEDRRLAIAKRIALEKSSYFDGSRYKQNQTVIVETQLNEAEIRIAKAQKSLSVFADPKNNHLYSMKAERKLISTNNMTELITVIASGASKGFTMRTLGIILKEKLKMALFGCDINVGLCKDAIGSIIEFVGDANYVRKAIRGKSSVFECLDQKDIVLQSTSRPKSKTGVRQMTFNEGECVVYVPLLGIGSGLGVIEIHGLCSNGITSLSAFERPIAAIKAMIESKDYGFKHTVRLWRLPKDRFGGSNHVDKKDYNVGNYQIVCGRIFEIAAAKNNQTYHGGPRYTIHWEDGLIDEALTATEFLKLYAQTPQSLGCASILDIEMTEQLLQLGNSIGEILESQRMRDSIASLKSRLNVPNLKDFEICERSLVLILAIIRGITEASIIGYNGTSKEPYCLVTKSNLSKSSKTRTISINDIVTKALEFNYKETPLCLMDGTSLQCVTYEMELPEGYSWRGSSDFKRFFLSITRYVQVNSRVMDADVNVLSELLETLSAAVHISWEKELRNKRRKTLQKEIETLIYNSRKMSTQETCINISEAITEIMPGCHIYMGATTEGAKVVTFFASNSNSCMIDKVLKRGQGVSFGVIERLDTVLLKPEDMNKAALLGEGALVEVLYGKIPYLAKIKKDRGHEKYDVQYQDVSKKVEAGVDISRILPLHSAFRIHRFGHVDLPFLCVPIRNRNKGLGVVGIDTFFRVPKAPYDPQPEQGLVKFVDSIGRMVGTMVDVQRKKDSIRRFLAVSENPNSDIVMVADAAFDALCNNLYYVDSLVLVRIVYEKVRVLTEKEKISKQKENLQKKKEKEKKQKEKMKQKLKQKKNGKNEEKENVQDDEKPERLPTRELPRGSFLIHRRGDKIPEVESKIFGYDVEKSSHKTLQKVGDKIVLLLFKLKPEVKDGEGKIYLMGLSSKEPIQDPDYEYLETIHRLVFIALQSASSRKAAGDVRNAAIKDIQEICNAWQTMDKHELFNQVSEIVRNCYFSANMYIGKLGAHNKEIKYICASSHSNMSGKRLLRTMKKGLSFNVTDTLVRMGITPTSGNSNRLHHFGNSAEFQYPFVLLPIISRIDEVYGVLGVDACDDPTSDSDNIESTLSFMGLIGTHLSKAFTGYMIQDVREELRRIAYEASSFREGIREVKKVILNMLPYCSRIAEVLYSPKEVQSLIQHEVLGDIQVVTQDDYMVIAQILKVECLIKSIRGMTIQFFWRGRPIYKSDFSNIDNKPFSITIPKGIALEHATVPMVLKGYVDGNEKEISRKSLSLHYLVNTPLYVIDHVFSSPTVNEVYTAKIQLVSKVFAPDQEIALHIHSISIKGLLKTDRGVLPDTYISIKWNGDEVAKTVTVQAESDPKWPSLNINLQIDAKIGAENSVLILEAWDQDALGRGTFLGQVELTQTLLRETFANDHKNSWLYLTTGIKSDLDGDAPNNQGMIKIKGSSILACEMSEQVMLEELNVDLKVLENESEEEEQKVFHLCELRILSARDLNKTWGSFSTSPYAVVLFNGEEVGRTSVTKTQNPRWEEEVFEIRATSEDELETSILSVEVLDMGMSGSGSTLGIIEITGKKLTSLLSSNKLRKDWFDLDAKGTDQTNANGQIELAGRPMSIPLDGMDDETRDLGYLELAVQALSPSILDAIKDKFTLSMFFNSRKIYQSKKPINVEEGDTLDEKVSFRHPVNKDILHSTLRVEVEINNKIYFTAEVGGPKLVQLIGQNGCKTSWYAMESLVIKDDGEDNIVKFKIKLRGGPEGTHDIFDDDGREFWLDIKAASSLPVQKAAFVSSRPNSFCYIYWNNRRIGETKVITDSADPMWKRQRFIIKTPLIEGVQDSLSTCVLKIDVCNKTSSGFDVIGSVLLKESTISQLMGQRYAQIRWLPIANDAFKNLEVKPFLKVRGGLSDAEDDPDYDLGEYKLSIVSALELAAVETFRGSNAFVTVKWNDREIGRTQTIKDTTSPSFDNETFIIKLPPGGSLQDQSLEVSVYDNNFQGVPPDFLGGIILTKGSLVKFFRENEAEDKYFKLQKSPDLTEEENMFVKGSIYLKGSKEIVVHEDIAMFKESILQICNASGLSKTSTFGKGSDTYCIIYRYSRSEGGQDVEIHRTKVITKTLNPTFDERISFHIPEDDDWSGMRMRIEVWDVGGEFMGCLLLKDNDLKSLLGREGNDCLAPAVYDLKKKDGMAKHLQAQVQGKISLLGGSKEFFETVNLNTSQTEGKIDKEDSVESNVVDKEAGIEETKNVPEYDESGDSAIIRIYSAKDLNKVEVFGQSSPYCIIKWNGKEVGRTATIKANVNPVWEDEHFDVNLPKDIATSSSNLELEFWHRANTDVFLGAAQLQGELLANVFSISSEQIEIPLKPKIDFSTKQNKYATKGIVTLSGSVPRLQKEFEAKEKLENEIKQRNNKASTQSQDPDLKASRLQLHIIRLLGLIKPSFGGNNVVVQIYWPNENILCTQTEVINGTSDFVFDNEIFLLEKAEGFKLQDLSLRLTVVNRGVTSDTFVGEVLLKGDELVNLASSSLAKETTEFTLKKSAISRNPKHIKGSIEIIARSICSKNSKLQSSNSDLPDDMKELELSVLAGSTLAKANTFGLSDPFCIVKWDGVEIGKTSVIQDTIDPVWDDEQTFTFRVPKLFGASSSEKDAAAAKKLRKTMKRKDDEINSDDNNEIDMTDVELSIDIYDYNRMGGGVFLGCVQLKGEDLEEFIEGSTLKRKWFEVASTARLKKKDQKINAQGKLELMIGEKKSEIDLLEGTDIDIQICSARNLAKSDSFAQTSPYVKVRWNNKMVGKTSVIKNSLSPVWDHERFTFRAIKSIPIIDSILYCEVWDYSMLGKGNFLGSVGISGASLKEFIENPKFTSQWFTLVKTDYLPEQLQDLVQGEIELRCGYTNAQVASSDNCINYEINIFSANDLARSDGMFGLSDPFAVLKWNGREVGRTPHVPKNLNPVWDNQSFLIPVSEEQDVGTNTLEIEVYDYNLLSNGVFLGCVFLTGDALDVFLNDEEVPNVTLSLHKSKSIPESKQSLVQGKIKIGKKIISEDEDNDGGLVLPVSWQTERDVDAGYPLLELGLLSGKNLTKSTLSISGTDPYSDIFWNGEFIGTSSVASSSNPTWVNEKFILKIPVDIERRKKEESGLLIKVWDKDTFSKRFLGQIILPFQSLLCCHDGVFELALTPENKYQTVKGTITISLRIKYPFWDSIKSNIPSKFPRKIRIMSASNLPSINDKAPSTKCVIHYLGINKVKTMVVRSNSSPIWPQVQFELLVDLVHLLDVYLHVYHIDVEDRREILIGQALIPFEVILRAPAVPVDITLEPPARMPPKKYKFVVNGSVKIGITGNSNSSSILPWSANFDIPISALETNDIHVGRSGASKEDLIYDGKDLTKEDELWLGAAYNLGSVQTLPSKKEWTVVPIYDMGLRIGSTGADFVGSRPGKRFALCVERPIDKINLSDEILLAEIHDSLQHCIIQLRRKDIFKSMRSKMLKYYTELLASGNNLPIETYFKWIVRAIQTSIPGSSIFTATISADYKSLIYTLTESNGTTSNVTLYEGQGFDWEVAGKNPSKSIIIKAIKDLRMRRMMTFRPAFNTRFPRIVVPLVAGDVSLGLFGVENFDIMKGGTSDKFGAEKEIKTWLEDLGSLFGEAMYSAREKESLNEIEAYILGWTSTRDGLVQEILINLTNVLQGCKLMEIWSIAPDYNMKSIAYFTPQGSPPPGRSVMINIRLKTYQSILEKGAALVKGMSSPIKVPKANDNKANDDQDNVQQPKKKYMIGVRHDDMEQLHMIPATSITIKGDINYDLQDIKVVVTNDRNLYIHCYEVDNDLNIIEDFNNKCSFQTFKERNFKMSLASADSSTTFDADLNLNWAELGSGESTGEKLKTIKSFTVTIKSANGLLPPTSGNKLDTYCEVFFGKEKVGRTNVVKDSATPAWNETFTIPCKGKGQPLIIDVYEMTMLGKGPFRGRIEISVEQLLMPPLEDVDYALSPKSGTNAKKQQLVGGSLCLAYSMELHKIMNKDDNPELDAKLVTIPRTLWNMQTPAISLTITNATELSKANMFGNGSDAFVIIYLGTSPDPIARTQVIQDDWNPAWNETFTLNLGVTMEPDKTTINDFPNIRLEVWNSSRIGEGAFLGQCDISPVWYFSRKNGDFQLTPNKKLKQSKNKLVKGYLSASFKVIDNFADIGKQSFIFSPQKTLQNLQFVEIQILKCNDLLKANRFDGKSDPYVKIFWNECLCGETIHKKGTLDPQWNNEKFVINLSTVGYKIGDMVLEVWDKDFFSEGEFMGEYRIASDTLLHPSEGIQKLDLQNRPGVAKGKIKGTISFKLVQRFKMQRVDAKARDYIEEKSRAHKALPSPLPVTVIRDPIEEARRQSFEKSSFPGIISKAEELTNKYQNNPFERNGLISELHYGQVISSCQRSEHTVIKTDKTDMFCVPTSTSKTNDKSNFEKTKDSIADSKDAGQTEANDPDILYIIARYDTGKLSKRDSQFLAKVKEILVAGIASVGKRQQRISKRALLEESLKTLGSSAKDNLHSALVQGIMDMEYALGCATKIFLLSNDGKTFSEFVRTKSKTEKRNAGYDEFVKLAARVCRHGFVLQFYRGKNVVMDIEWTSHSQMSAISLSSIQEAVDEVEGEGTCQKLIDMAWSACPEGSCLVPLMTINEVLNGVMLINTANKIPHAVYKFKDVTKKTKQTTSRKNKGVQQDPLIELHAPEEGVSTAMVFAANNLGKAITSSRLGASFKKIKGYKITPETRSVDIIKFVFLSIMKAVPQVREIAIWGIDFNRIFKVKEVQKVATTNNGLLGFLFGNNNKNTSNEIIDDDNTETSNSFVAPCILAGYWGSEDPKQLLDHSDYIENLEAARLEALSKSSRDSFSIVNKLVAEPKLADWQTSVPNSLSTVDSPEIIARAGFHDNDLVKVVQSEAMRCKSILKQATFKTVSGHLLACIGSDKASYDKIAHIFDQNLNDYHDKKQQLKMSRAIEKLKAFEVERAKKIRQQEEERLAMEAIESMKASLPDDSVNDNKKTITKKFEADPSLDEERTEEDFLSDSDSDNDIEYFNAYKKTLKVPEPTIAIKKNDAAPLLTSRKIKPPAPPTKLHTGHHISGTSNVEHSPRPNISPRSNNSPRSSTNARPTAPLPSGLPPTSRSNSNTNVATNDDESNNKTQSTETLSTKYQTIPRQYFIAMKTNGLGGDTGWGVIGETLEKAIAEIASGLDQALARRAKEKINLKEKDKQLAKKAEDEAKKSDRPGPPPKKKDDKKSKKKGAKGMSSSKR